MISRCRSSAYRRLYRTEMHGSRPVLHIFCGTRTNHLARAVHTRGPRRYGDLVIDPRATLSAYGAAFPSHLVVRTADMKLTHADSGGDVADLALAIDAVLAE